MGIGLCPTPFKVCTDARILAPDNIFPRKTGRIRAHKCTKSGMSDILSGLDWPVRVNKGASSDSPLGIRTDFCVEFVWFRDDRSLEWAEGASNRSISLKTLKGVAFVPNGTDVQVSGIGSRCERVRRGHACMYPLGSTRMPAHGD
jgi:hypothetical protein